MLPVRKNQNWLPSIFNDFFDNDWMMRSPVTTSPAINIVENEDSFNVEVAAPGLTKKDFKVSLDHDVLVIAMDKQEEKTKEEKNGKYIHREFSHSSFNQKIALPENINKDKITAKVVNGILNITLPKLEESKIKESTKYIEIN